MHCTALEWLKWKKSLISSVGKDVSNGTLNIAMGVWKDRSILESCLAGSLMNQQFHFWGYVEQKCRHTCTKRCERKYSWQTLSIIAPNQKQSKYSLTVEWVNNLWHIHPKEYNAAKRKNELFLHANNMGEAHKYNFDWNKPDAKEATLYDSICVHLKIDKAINLCW